MHFMLMHAFLAAFCTPTAAVELQGDANKMPFTPATCDHHAGACKAGLVSLSQAQPLFGSS